MNSPLLKRVDRQLAAMPRIDAMKQPEEVIAFANLVRERAMRQKPKRGWFDGTADAILTAYLIGYRAAQEDQSSKQAARPMTTAT